MTVHYDNIAKQYQKSKILPPESFPTCKKYGFTKNISGMLKEGAAITYEFYREGQQFRFDNYYLSKKTHEWAFKKVGFSYIGWKQIEVDPEGVNKLGKDYWQDFIDYEPIIGIECRYNLPNQDV
jgi:hypothetical protein